MKNCINKITNITFKTIALIILIALSFLGVFSAPLMNAVQNLSAFNNGNVSSRLKIVNFKKSANLRDKTVNVPYGETDSADNIVNVKILNPKGDIIFDNLDTDKEFSLVTKDDTNKVYKLSLENAGTYKVQYSIKSKTNADIVTLDTQEYKIVVTGDKATMEFAENSKEIIPSITNDEYQIVLPNPSIKDSEGNIVDQADIFDGLTIKVKETYSGKVFSSSPAGTETQLEKVGDNYVFTPNAEVDCDYVITYSYVDELTNLTTTEVFETAFEKEFDASNIKLGYKLNGGAIPEKMELGVETKLPTISVYDENDADLVLDAYTDVKVVFIPNTASAEKYADKLDEGKDYVTVATDFNFTPMFPSSEGSYKITYKISDFFNLSQDKVNKTLVYSINDVKDSTAPTTYAVADYAVTDGNIAADYEIEDVSFRIPTKVATGTIVDFPAIYATDNISSFNGLYSNLSRVLVKEKGGNETLTKAYKFVDGAQNKTWVTDVKANEFVSYEFTTPGTYTIRYEATDEAGKYNYTGTNFTIVVEDGFVDETAPKITMNAIPAIVKAGEKISFAKPTAVDFAEDSVTNIDDKNLEIAYYYYTSELTNDSLNAELAKARKGEASALTKLEEDENDNEKLSFIAPASDVTIVCVAYDDAGNIGKETRKVSVVNITDNVAPNIETENDDYITALEGETLSQDEIIHLPTFSVEDGANTKYLEGKVAVVDNKGNTVSVIGAKYTTSADEFTISNARFVAARAGNYTITYTINDIGGNYVVQSYMLNIADTKAPTIEIDGLLSNVEVGQSYKIPTFTVKDNGEIITPKISEIRFIGDNNPSYSFNNGTLEFTALETGTFTYEYYAMDVSGNDTISGPFTFTAKDGQLPTIKLDGEIDKTYALEKIEGTETYKAIVIPGYTAEDTLNGIKDSKVEVKSPSGKLLKVEKVTDGTGYKFTPTVDGVYTVIYSATDLANNISDAKLNTYEIRVGDTTKPSMVIDGLDINAPSELKINSVLDLDLSQIFVTDSSFKTDAESSTTITADKLDDQTNNNGYKMFTVKVTRPNGSTVSADEGTDYEYTLKEAGKYTITYTARDKANNERIIKKYVEVVADENSSNISTETWSVILIVASLAVLGGVVFYFVKTRDKKPTKKIITSKEDFKDENN